MSVRWDRRESRRLVPIRAFPVTSLAGRAFPRAGAAGSPGLVPAQGPAGNNEERLGISTGGNSRLKIRNPSYPSGRHIEVKFGNKNGIAETGALGVYVKKRWLLRKRSAGRIRYLDEISFTSLNRNGSASKDRSITPSFPNSRTTSSLPVIQLGSDIPVKINPCAGFPLCSHSDGRFASLKFGNWRFPEFLPQFPSFLQRDQAGGPPTWRPHLARPTT